MDIMEPRRRSESVLSLVALREFSRRLKVLAFIGREVCNRSDPLRKSAAWRVRVVSRAALLRCAR
jgi:hypothetical protein